MLTDLHRDHYDYLIVGGGIGGLYLGWYLRRRLYSKNVKIAILEANDQIGGRVLTKYVNSGTKRGDSTGLNYELGAGRVSSQNKILLELVDYFGLTLTPLDSHFQWSDGSTTYSFAQTMMRILPLLGTLQLIRITTPTRKLAGTTIQALLLDYFSKETVDRFLELFPYTSEIVTANAYDGFAALDSFGFQNNFYLVKEGLNAITEGLAQEFLANGGKIVTDAKVLDLRKSKDQEGQDLWQVKTASANSDNRKYLGKEVILTCNYQQLLEIPLFQESLGVLIKSSGVGTSPLLRIYANYPTNGDRKDHSRVWFAGLSRTATNLPLRLVIPINEKTGTIMVSYTDGPDAEWWPLNRRWNLGEQQPLLAALHQQLSTLFPQRTIPEPVTVTPCYWKEGGNFNKPNKMGWTSAQIKRRVRELLPDGVYVVNNDLSPDKNWMEGSLLEVQGCLTTLLV